MSTQNKIRAWGLVALMTLATSVALADPPYRVARLNFVQGSVSFLPAGAGDWGAAPINYPLTTGDTIWADRDGVVEMHIGSTAIRMNAQTSVGFLNLDDHAVQLRMTQGMLSVHLRRLDPDQIFEIDTPNGAVSLLQPGNYRVDSFPDSQGTMVTVRSGQAEVTGGGTAFAVQGGQLARIAGLDQLSYDVVAMAPPDGWDQWCFDRDRMEDQSVSARYIGTEVIGYADLDNNGVWVEEAEYGHVWRPRGVPADWAPYRYGHWAYVVPWGWTWIDDAPWGFAPFHYGRWAYIGGGWAWVPGPVVARPVYAPALVAFVGGSHFNLSIALGGGGAVAWFPLGPREIYHPAYRVSDNYVRTVNVTNVRNITNVTNISSFTNVRYVNQTVATTVVPQDVFVRQRRVAQEALSVPPHQLAAARVLGSAPENVTPPPRPMFVRRGTAPPPAVVERSVVARTPPPPITQSRPGVAAPDVPPVRQALPAVRVVPPAVHSPAISGVPQPGQPAQPVQPAQPGRRFGEIPNARPAQPAQAQPEFTRPAPPLQPVQPAQPTRPAQPNRPFGENPEARPARPMQPQPEVMRPAPRAPLVERPMDRPRPAERPDRPAAPVQPNVNRPAPQERPAPRQANPANNDRREQRREPRENEREKPQRER